MSSYNDEGLGDVVTCDVEGCATDATPMRRDRFGEICAPEGWAELRHMTLVTFADGRRGPFPRVYVCPGCLLTAPARPFRVVVQLVPEQ